MIFGVYLIVNHVDEWESIYIYIYGLLIDPNLFSSLKFYLLIRKFVMILRNIN